jgi:tetraacyldisaccharide 4'-kinase
MKLRYFLFPFSFFYGLITSIRNTLYDNNLLSSKSHELKTIVVGNLSTGGTGKSPFVLYLIELLNKEKNLGILSRGYGRKSKGYLSLSNDSKADEVGDEPLMFLQNSLGRIQASVCEDRNEGINSMISDNSNLECIILDDAFQHRKLKSGFNILLTTFQDPFFNDYLLPAGNLRELRKGALRSNVIVVTKCPSDLTQNQKVYFEKKLKKYERPVFFSNIQYGQIKSFTKEAEQIKSILLVAGIANPKNMFEYLNKNYYVEEFMFSDHHNYTQADIQKIHQKFDTFASDSKAIVTTLKDFMRLKDKIHDWGLNEYPWYVLPITIEIDRETEFIKLIKDYVG